MNARMEQATRGRPPRAALCTGATLEADLRPENMKRRIAIIDDSRAKRAALAYVLRDSFDISAYGSGREALPDLLRCPPDLILLDIEMPDEDGFCVIRNIKAQPTLRDIPVIFITSVDDRHVEAEGLRLGAVDFISRNFVPETILARVNVHLELQAYRRSLEDAVREKTRMVEKLQDSIVITLSDLVECRDVATSGHARRTISYVEILCRELAARGMYADLLTPETIEVFMRAAPLHDIGKVGIDDAILNKPGRLNDLEFDAMRHHTLLGARAIQRAIDQMGAPTFLDVVKEMTLYHHERWDGMGYPFGLQGEEIPLCARIMAVADVYDALISERPYKPPLSQEQVVAIMAGERGRQFDPAIMDVFLSIHEKFAAVAAETER
ncbi:MAG: two-component system response regulator [Desulfovibrionaceae bacterium]|nr:MAG: two-component system response regulator [Desulfovibrionaceae bacterium]